MGKPRFILMVVNPKSGSPPVAPQQTMFPFQETEPRAFFVSS